MPQCFISCSSLSFEVPSSWNIEDGGGVGCSLCCAQVSKDAAVRKHASKTRNVPGAVGSI